jgi:hypothetical protein
LVEPGPWGVNIGHGLGVGSHFVVTDMNGDGMPDIVTSTNLGTFVFQNLRKKRVS